MTITFELHHGAMLTTRAGDEQFAILDKGTGEVIDVEVRGTKKGGERRVQDDSELRVLADPARARDYLLLAFSDPMNREHIIRSLKRVLAAQLLEFHAERHKEDEAYLNLAESSRSSGLPCPVLPPK
jgi:hypothetical protein